MLFCRTAIVLGTSIPLALFLVWNAVILASITNVDMSSNKIMDPLQQLQSTNEVVGVGVSREFLSFIKITDKETCFLFLFFYSVLFIFSAYC